MKDNTTLSKNETASATPPLPDEVAESSNDASDMALHLPEEVTEILRDVKPETRKEIERIMVSQFSMISRISPDVEVSKKITSDHITTMLNTRDKAMEHTFQDNKGKRWFSIALVFLACVVLVAIILLLKDTPDTMEKIITIVLSALLGGAGGYGIGFSKGKDGE
jgi:hypothetical protein